MRDVLERGGVSLLCRYDEVSAALRLPEQVLRRLADGVPVLHAALRDVHERHGLHGLHRHERTALQSRPRPVRLHGYLQRLLPADRRLHHGAALLELLLCVVLLRLHDLRLLHRQRALPVLSERHQQ